jgi:dTDP-4-amino-4,6-dideoxygalactose transaminase
MIGQDDANAAARVVLSGWLSQGEQVAAFEAEFAALVNAPHACAVSNCTTALHLALLAAGVGFGHEVVTVSSSFIATANVIRQCGATPVFVDIEPDSFNIDPEAIAAALTPRTRAVLCVHQIGMPCDLARIVPLARQQGVPLIEDAACATGSRIQLDGSWQAIGAPHGDIACFSFHPRKVVTTGEGGMITTRHAEWDRQIRLWRQHGMSIADTVRHKSAQVVFESYPVSGFNYRMTDIQAAVGRQQLMRLPDIITARRKLALRYREMLAGTPDIRLPTEPAWAQSNWQSFSVRLPAGANQRAVMQSMLDAGIATRRGIMCAHLEGAYAASSTPMPLSESERARDHCILLPLYAQMTEDEQRQVVAALHGALAAQKTLPMSGRRTADENHSPAMQAAQDRRVTLKTG